MVKSILPVNVEDVVVRKRGKAIIGPLSMKLSDQGNTIIIGPNGAGKTTLLRAIHNLERIRSGQVNWSTTKTQASLAQSFVFQTPRLMRRTTLENLIYPLLLRKMPKTKAVTLATSWLTRMGMEHAQYLDAHLLSGGEKQKLAIARALIVEPQLLILDEPTTNLDGISTKEIEAILLKAKENGVKLLMTTHDLGQVKRLADEVIFLHKGQVLEQSSAPTFFRKPKTAEATAFLKGDIVV